MSTPTETKNVALGRFLHGALGPFRKGLRFFRVLPPKLNPLTRLGSNGETDPKAPPKFTVSSRVHHGHQTANEKDAGVPAEFSKGEHSSPHWEFGFVDLTRIEAGEHIVPAKINSALATEFAELHMIVNDFSFSLDCFREADKIGLPDSQNLLSKSLIFSAVVAYARPFKTGVRQLRMNVEYFSAIPAFNIEIHDYIIAVRDKHVAHSVNEFERSATTGVMVGTPSTNWRPAGVGVTTLHSVGLSRRIIEGAITQISGMLDLLRARMEIIKPEIFRDFKEKFEKDGKWEMAPIATFPDRNNAAKRRS
jgi:hypothetical protein